MVVDLEDYAGHGYDHRGLSLHPLADASALEHRLKHGASQASPPFRVTDFTAEPLVFSQGAGLSPTSCPLRSPRDSS